MDKEGLFIYWTQGLVFCLTEHLLWAPRLNNALLPTRNETPALCHATFSLLGSWCSVTSIISWSIYRLLLPYALAHWILSDFINASWIFNLSRMTSKHSYRNNGNAWNILAMVLRTVLRVAEPIWAPFSLRNNQILLIVLDLLWKGYKFRNKNHIVAPSWSSTSSCNQRSSRNFLPKLRLSELNFGSWQMSTARLNI